MNGGVQAYSLKIKGQQHYQNKQTICIRIFTNYFGEKKRQMYLLIFE